MKNNKPDAFIAWLKDHGIETYNVEEKETKVSDDKKEPTVTTTIPLEPENNNDVPEPPQTEE